MSFCCLLLFFFQKFAVLEYAKVNLIVPSKSTASTKRISFFFCLFSSFQSLLFWSVPKQTLKCLLKAQHRQKGLVSSFASFLLSKEEKKIDKRLD
jgi:hypothetical protein